MQEYFSFMNMIHSKNKSLWHTEANSQEEFTQMSLLIICILNSESLKIQRGSLQKTVAHWDKCSYVKCTAGL